MKKNNFKSLMQAAVLICTPLVIASCDDVFGDVDNPIPSHLTVSQAAVNLELHADRPDAATFIRKGIAATGAQLAYSSSDEKVATVDANGKITGVGEGECQIIVKATGLDSNGKQTYQEAEESFTVKVKDYRARIALKEGATKAVFNSSLADPTKAINLAEVLDVWPAQGTTGLTIQYGTISGGTFTPFTLPYTSGDVINIDAAGKITLKPSYSFGTTDKHHKSVKIAAHISAKPDAFEVKSFADKQTTAEFTIDVREGIAYITGYDANNKAIEGSMFYLDDDEDGTEPNYTILDNTWATALPTGDVYLKAGWYSIVGNVSLTGKNIRVQGDANFVFASGADLDLATGQSIMDATTNKSYKLNLLPAKGATYAGVNSSLRKIQDFNEVNILMPKVLSTEITKIGTLDIAGGSFSSLNDIETLNFKSGSVSGKVDKVTTANIAAGTFSSTLENIGTLDFKSGTVNGLYKIGTANITDGTFNGGSWGTPTVTAAFYDVTTLNIKEATINSNLNKIGTATISTTNSIAGNLIDITTLDFKKGTVTGNLSKIGTATISDGTFGSSTSRIAMGGTSLNIKKGTVYASEIKSALIIDGGTVDVDASGAGTAITGNITMNDGKLKVVADNNGKHAIVGDVEVVKGTFTAENANYVAVNGKLTGSFEESTNGTTWTKVTATTSAAPYVKNVVPTAAP